MDPDGSYAWQAAAAEARKPLRLRVRSAARGLLFWGLAAAALALSVMLAPMGSLFLLGPCAPPTDAEAAGLRAEAALLLLSGAGQALAAQVALLVPWRPLAYLAWVVATPTFNHATAVLLRIVAAPAISMAWSPPTSDYSPAYCSWRSSHHVPSSSSERSSCHAMHWPSN
ncbi:uncharacterized protein LOC101784974 [Setaria italica]|uniref:uncharacterized protein LOC101784974 n=1 Tax=Setaria italica TaxID=4555 RepID=UPI000BE50904|nr:uncharacterized protein LOC101784974 [Setaria italica]